MPGSVLHAVARLTAADPRTDAALVRAFLAGPDEAAFAELVRRHGPAVFGVCRRLLGPTPDAEDAFQATFLVLVRRARSTEWREALGPWLYGVALKVARKSRAARARHRTRERPEHPMSEPTTAPAEPDDAGAVLDEELAALPARYRVPLVLCELQGTSRRDAARELGLAEGTLSSRLARGRKLLRARLVRRGAAPAIGGLAVAVPAELAGATVRNAARALARSAGGVPVAILSLTDEVAKTMVVKWKLALALCAALVGFGTWRTSAQPAPVNAPPAARAPADEKKPGPLAAPKAHERPKTNDALAAVIFGDVRITLEQFAEHLIRRHGQKELEQFVNKHIIAHTFKTKGLALKNGDAAAELEADCAALGVTREVFTTDVLPKHGKSLDQWLEDVIEPRIMMSRLLGEKAQAPTDAELRQAFDARYGERLACRIICWPKDKGQEAWYAAYRIHTGRDSFDTCARRQPEPGLAAIGGCIPPLPRNPGPDANSSTVAAAKLKPGEFSPPVETDTAFVMIKCDRVVPPDRTKSFEKEKPALFAELTSNRLEREIPKLFAEYKRAADPKYHLTFPERDARSKPPAGEREPKPVTSSKTPEGPIANDAERVATIFGDVPVTREQFTEHLMRRYGRRELKLFVNREIIRTAFTRAGHTLTAEEVAGALDAACATAKMSREQFAREILKSTGKTLDAWNEDMSVPHLMLTRLAKVKAPAPTEAELRQAFDRRHGEKFDCRVILWNKEDEARKAYEKVRASEKEFDAHARRNPQAGRPRSSVTADGRAEPIPRAQPFDDSAAERAVHAAAVKLRPGEVSPLVPVEIDGTRGFLALKCDRIIPADKSKSFEKERATLLDDVLRAKVGSATEKLARELVQEAAPKYHLTFPERDALPTPAPVRK